MRMQTIFEAMGGTYRQEGDYLLPNIEVPESLQIGVWGQQRRTYLREHNKALYTAMLLSDELDVHLKTIDRNAEQLFDRLIFQFAAAEGLTEDLKAANQMAWVQGMNSIRNRAQEVVLTELIYA